MATTGEGETAVVTSEQLPVEQPKKPAKAKKTKDLKENKPRSAKAKASQLSHPPYFQMIQEALLALQEKSGSSPYAVAKYMEDKHKTVLPANFRKILAIQLKNCVAKGKLIKIKASYKLSESGKKEKVVKAKVPESKSGAAASKSAKVAKKSETQKKKPTRKVSLNKKKRSTPAKPKQPKSIKSPAAKKAKRATAA